MVAAAPVTKRPLVALLAADAVSMSGNVAANVAIPWFVLQSTGSATKTGLTAFASLVPVVLSGVFGGALVDRLGYRRMSIVADLASGATVAAIPLLSSTVGLSFPALLALVFLGALLDAPGVTARASLLPDVAAAAGWSLERVSGLSAVVERSSRLAGAPLAGVLIAATGPEQVLWIDAGTFLVSAALIAAGITRPPRGAPREDRAYFRELREGLAFLRADRTLLVLVAVLTITNGLDSVSFVLLPVYADEVYGSAVSLGLMLGLLGAGSVVGAFAFSAIGERLSRRLVFTWCFVFVAIWYPVAAVFPPLWILLVARVVAGIAAGPLNPVIDTVFFERVPDGMRGRVFGVTQAAAWVAVPLGVLVAGPLLEWAGIEGTIWIVFGIYLAITLAATLFPALRGMDQPPATAGRIDTVSPSETSVSSEPR